MELGDRNNDGRTKKLENVEKVFEIKLSRKKRSEAYFGTDEKIAGWIEYSKRFRIIC